jgi:hypothetical protein
MARIYIDGFETGDVAHWDWRNPAKMPTAAAVGATGLDGAYYMLAPAAGAEAYKTLPSSLSELWMCMWFRVGSGGPGSKILLFRDSVGTVLGTLGSAGSRFTLYKGDVATLLGTGTTVISNNTIYKLEMRYKPHLTDGVFELKVNGGAAEITASGVSTSPSTVNVAQLFLSIAAAAGVDNIIVDDAAYPGVASNIIALVPNANGSLNEFTPSTGNNYETVDEVPPSSTDYNGVNAVDKTDLFTKEECPGAVYQVKAVQVHARCVKEGSSTPTTMKLAVRSGGNTYLSTEKAIGILAVGVQKLWATDPATGSSWTVDGLNSAEFGYKSAA